MNIFRFDNEVKHCSGLDDKRLPKMILESVQMLCTARLEYGLDAPYKAAHVGHPCTQWVISHICNYNWLHSYATMLYAEYRKYFNGREHKSGELLPSLDLRDHEEAEHLWHYSHAPIPQAMPRYYQIARDPFIAYRHYFAYAKNLNYSRCPEPYFVTSLRRERVWAIEAGSNLQSWTSDSQLDYQVEVLENDLYLPANCYKGGQEGEMFYLDNGVIEICVHNSQVMQIPYSKIATFRPDDEEDLEVMLEAA